MTDKESAAVTDRGLYAECKGAYLEALQELGLLQWFDMRSSITPFKRDPRPLLRLHGINGRIDYAWIGPVENWRELVGPKISAEVDAIGKNRGGGDRPLLDLRAVSSRQPKVGRITR